MIALARGIWRSKWGLVRLAVALVVLWAVATETPARLARLRLASLPQFDYAAEVSALRLEGRYGEAQVVASAGLGAAEGAAREGIVREAEKARREQESLLRRATEFGTGAITGRGESLESLVGAVAADFFLVGDLRDLVIEGGKQLVDGDSDEVILLLSVAGVVTTVAPQVDWAPSLLKVARKTGTMTKGVADFVTRSLRARDGRALAPLFADVATIAGKASPGGAVRLLKHADDPGEVATLARFLEREPAGAFALHVTGREGAAFVKGASHAGERLVVDAARKGRAGAEFLRTPAARVLLRPHPIIGVVKAVYKGNAERLIARAAAGLGPHSWWLLPAAAAWVLVEGALIARRCLSRGRARPG